MGASIWRYIHEPNGFFGLRAPVNPSYWKWFTLLQERFVHNQLSTCSFSQEIWKFARLFLHIVSSSYIKGSLEAKIWWRSTHVWSGKIEFWLEVQSRSKPFVPRRNNSWRFSLLFCGPREAYCFPNVQIISRVHSCIGFRPDTRVVWRQIAL